MFFRGTGESEGEQVTCDKYEVLNLARAGDEVLLSGGERDGNVALHRGRGRQARGQVPAQGQAQQPHLGHHPDHHRDHHLDNQD